MPIPINGRITLDGWTINFKEARFEQVATNYNLTVVGETGIGDEVLVQYEVMSETPSEAISHVESDIDSVSISPVDTTHTLVVSNTSIAIVFSNPKLCEPS